MTLAFAVPAKADLTGDNQVLELLPVILRPLFRVFTVGDFSVKFDVLHYL